MTDPSSELDAELAAELGVLSEKTLTAFRAGDLAGAGLAIDEIVAAGGDRGLFAVCFEWASVAEAQQGGTSLSLFDPSGKQRDPADLPDTPGAKASLAAMRFLVAALNRDYDTASAVFDVVRDTEDGEVQAGFLHSLLRSTENIRRQQRASLS